MGIDLALHSQRPAKRNWRETLLQESYEHGELLATLLPKLHQDSRLGAVDPYGDTTFNEQQAEASIRECDQLRELCTSAADRAAVDDLERMLRACAETPGSYLCFIGD